MTCALTRAHARANFADVLLNWIDEPTDSRRRQLFAAASTYTEMRYR